MKKEVVALIEIGGSHDECLLTQFHALKSSSKLIAFVTTQEILDRNPTFEKYIDHQFVLLKEELSDKFKAAIKIKKYLKKVNASKVVLNTAHGNIARNLAVICLFNKMQFFGILHTTIKLEESFTQKLISWKVRNYFLLSEFLCNKAQKISKLNFDWFYPIRFDNQQKEKTSNTKTRIVVIGGVENRRKDLSGFVDMIEGIKQDVEFIFLGKSEAKNEEVIAFKEKLAKKGLEDKVKLYDSFVSNDEFATIVNACDAILPLVHPNTPSAKEYFNRQISGAMTVAFGYKKPLLIHDAYAHIHEMQIASVYYYPESFKEVLTENEQLKVIELAMQQSIVLQVETQEKRYLDFMEIKS
ncbi:MAG TPA: hypothetical protein EYG86_05735 [Crocinitomicaceae bacterium]|nr:hypothetical protein [Crocinitomicaceae bacterium]